MPSEVAVNAGTAVAAGQLLASLGNALGSYAQSGDFCHTVVNQHPVFATAASLGIALERVPLDASATQQLRDAGAIATLAGASVRGLVAQLSAADRADALRIGHFSATVIAGQQGMPAPPAFAPTPDDIFRIAQTQFGKRYVLGADVKDDDPDPPAFDCAEYVRWVAKQAGVNLDGDWSWTGSQMAELRKQGYVIPVEQAMRTPGALLYNDTHVVISRGDGTTLEARGKDWGVGSWSATVGRKGFTMGALIPGVDYGL